MKFSQGEPAPAHLPRHRYGASGTIHQTGTIDIQVDAETGEVVAVWFRCLSLPFQVSKVSGRRPCNPDLAVEEITYVELSPGSA